MKKVTECCILRKAETCARMCVHVRACVCVDWGLLTDDGSSEMRYRLGSWLDDCGCLVGVQTENWSEGKHSGSQKPGNPRLEYLSAGVAGNQENVT